VLAHFPAPKRFKLQAELAAEDLFYFLPIVRSFDQLAAASAVIRSFPGVEEQHPFHAWTLTAPPIALNMLNSVTIVYRRLQQG
jgi:hypothetical protein